MSTLASFLYGTIQSSLQTVENIVQPSPEKKKKQAAVCKSLFHPKSLLSALPQN